MHVYRVEWPDELDRLAKEHDNPGGYESMQIQSAAQAWQAERERTAELCKATRLAINDLIQRPAGVVPETAMEALKLVNRIEGGQTK